LDGGIRVYCLGENLIDLGGDSHMAGEGEKNPDELPC